MKTCTKCGDSKDEKHFSKKRNGLAPSCKVCTRQASKKHYGENREIYIAKAMSQRHALRRLVDELKSGPCGDCGGKFPPVCMDFDHRDRERKKQAVSIMVQYGSKSNILAEIEKCDLVCANCHRIRTFMVP